MIKALLAILKFQVWTKVHLFEKQGVNYYYLNVQDVEILDRYLLNFLLQLNSCSPTIIVIPLKIKFLKRFFEGRNWRTYQTMLIQSSNLHFALKTNLRAWKAVNFDYFRTEIKNIATYKVTIGPHPIHFNNYRKVSGTEKRNGIYFSGAQSQQYSKNFSNNTWGMPSRVETIEFLKENGLGEIIFNRMSPDAYFTKLKQSAYFLALPGMYMPLSHNVFEAMFSGCIPIIHLRYLQLLPETMQEELTPYSWDSHVELLQLISKLTNEIHAREEKTRIACAKFANSYFHNPILHDSVAKAETIIICAEEHSVRIKESAML